LQQGKKKYLILLLTDTQSNKNTDIQTKENTGFDGGKKVKGIKKSITIDIAGFLPDARFKQIDTANINERKLCEKDFEEVFKQTKCLAWLDKCRRLSNNY
jgi:hypothetical protein